MVDALIIRFSPRSKSQIYTGSIGDILPVLVAGRRVVAIVDRNVSYLVPQLGDVWTVIEIEAKEENKSLETAQMLWKRLVEIGADRDVFLLGVGGGVTTDLVGFVAGTYMRGVSFGFVPTTLLAQVDAAIGGKTGINFGGYKNMVGTFALPEFVVCDHEVFYTLSRRELLSGMAEVIKVAVVGDERLFELCEKNSMESILHQSMLCSEMINRAIKVKYGVVSRDLQEAGERRTLNFGHTLAHAIESCTKEYTHGEAVAIGMVYVSQMAVEQGLLSVEDSERIVKLLKQYGLPTSTDLPMEALFEAVNHDKKNSKGKIGWVLPTGIGNSDMKY